ncbi:zinc ribbon domain-containing protein [Deinococcus altitudinis]|uniref:zinc ribbon domain-containing protein n=1 Tax=Deinococcus altitudinis TaxID=468914 RepID=UPI0038929E91
MTRAVCEACGADQPPDWQPGDLCVQCGEAARREQRCHWCTRLTPEGNFCRHCGSGLVADGLYGAARMLKAAGVDQFSLPERLNGMPPEQREHFSRLYAPHGRMVERHLDDLSFVVGSLRAGRGRPSGGPAGNGARRDGLSGSWIPDLEDALLPLLPLPEAELRALTLPPTRAVTDLERLAEIRDGSPFALTSQLSALAAIRLTLRLGVPRNELDARWAAQALNSPDEAVQQAAALTLADWRFTAGHPYAAQPGHLRDVLSDLYRRTAQAGVGRADPLHAEAGLGLALLAQHYANVQSVPVPAELLTPLLSSEDPDLAFGAALALGETGALRAALRVPERRALAAARLARLGEIAPLAPVLRLLEPDEQSRVLGTLRVAAPELNGVLLELLGNRETRTEAARLLLLEGRPGNALPLVEADPDLAEQVLRNPALSARDTEQVCVRLLAQGRFRLSRLGVLRELAESGGISDAFVPEQFVAASEEGRQELFVLAGLQLAARADPALHRFLWHLIESDSPFQTRERAWSVLASWYGRYGQELRCSLAGARQFFGGATFGGVEEFVDRLCRVIERPDMLAGFFTSYHFLKLLEDTDPDVVPAVRETASAGRLRRALLALARDEEQFAPYRAGAVRLLGQLSDSAEGHLLRAELTPFLHSGAPWQMQRAALAALYPDPEAQAAQLAEWKAQKDLARSYEERAPLDDLIFQLQQVMAG